MSTAKKLCRKLMKEGIVDFQTCDKPKCNYVKLKICYDDDGVPIYTYYNTIAGCHVCEKKHRTETYENFLLRLGIQYI